MKIEGFTHKLLEIKEEFETVNPSFRMGVVEDEEDFKFQGRTVAVVLDGENISESDRKTIDIIFYYSRSKEKTKDKILDFRKEVKDFTRFLGDYEDRDFTAQNKKIEYGNFSDETGRASIRTASIKVTYDITSLRDVEVDNDYELMDGLYMDIEVSEE
jgi:hypothetical protein